MPEKLLILLLMKIKEIRYSSVYIKSFKKYSAQRKTIDKKINIFMANPFEKSLRTHKLTGRLSGFWSFSINYHLRIIFYFIAENVVGFVNIGTHGIYK